MSCCPGRCSTCRTDIKQDCHQRQKEAVFYSPPHIPMDSSWTLHNLLKSHDNPFKVLWSPPGVSTDSTQNPQILWLVGV